MENKKRKKIKHIFKSILFYIKLIFYVVIGILSFGVVVIVLSGSKLEEELFYEYEYELMRRREQFKSDTPK